MTTSTRRSGIILGFASPGVMLLAVVGLGLFTFIPAAVASSSKGSLASAISDAAMLAVAATLVALAASARVAATGQRLRVTNLFNMITVDAAAIAKIDVGRGLIITTSGGRRIRSFAYGASLAGDVLGYRRARAAQRRCEAWLDEVAAPEASIRSSDVVAALRPAVWFLPAVLLSAYVAEVLVVRAIR